MVIHVTYVYKSIIKTSGILTEKCFIGFKDNCGYLIIIIISIRQ